jgi:hypothetical protein
MVGLLWRHYIGGFVMMFTGVEQNIMGSDEDNSWPEGIAVRKIFLSIMLVMVLSWDRENGAQKSAWVQTVILTYVPARLDPRTSAFIALLCPYLCYALAIHI